jgi:diguanylate cyclase (GGDEF)-like protein/PAS domain S-box-containing protein
MRVSRLPRGSSGARGAGRLAPLLAFALVAPIAGWLIHGLHMLFDPHEAVGAGPMDWLFEGVLGGLLGLMAAGVVWTGAALRNGRLRLEEELKIRTDEIASGRARLEAIFNTIPDMVWLKDPDGTYLDCNARFERLYGLPSEKIIGRCDGDFNTAEVAAAFRENDLLAIQAGGPRRNEEWVQCAGETERMLLETIKTPIYGEGGHLIGVLGMARDITERKRQEESLKESETRLSVALDSTQVGIWDWHITRDTWYASSTYYTMLGYAPETGAGDRSVWLARLHPEHRDEAVQRIRSVLQGLQTVYQYDARVLHADGTYRWCSVRGKVVEWQPDGAPYRMVGVRFDIHELKAAQERIEWMARYDMLTGLPNRGQLQERLQPLLQAGASGPGSLALAFVDLDRFKNVNDTLGHRVGDALLVALARRMQALAGDQGFIARQGGDEFILVLPGADEAAAVQAGQALIESVSRPCAVEGYELVVTPSVGIAMYPRDAADFDTLFGCADIAMHCAKQGGRNGLRLFTAEMQYRSARVLQLENAMRRALERGEFSLCYQPQVRLKDNRLIGAEALLRWQHPELGAVSPAEFISIAEDSGQILAIGDWVLREAATQMKRWHDAGLPPITLAVNVSAVQFRHPGLLERVARILEETGLPPECLELELTEGVAMDDPQGAVAMMDRLHALQVRLSIDDFGTGYSSLSYLKRFQVHKLKIDQSFVRNTTQDEEDRVIVGAIISLASTLGMQTIAEGVETEEQLAFLRRLGCEEAQGYLFSRPLPPAAFEEFARAQRMFSPA